MPPRSSLSLLKSGKVSATTPAKTKMIQDGNKIVVRSRATGTPKGPLFGVDGKGKGFDILTIDIHTVENGKITRSYHVEDWAGALQQLKGK